MAAATMRKRFLAFFTHNWGNDEQGRSNHARVVHIARALKARDLPVWIDEDEMTGDIVAQMCAGIDNSETVVVFVTHVYAQKVSSAESDNCKMEFAHAMRLLKPSNMIPVVMEESMVDASTWCDRLGMAQGDALSAVKMWEDSDISGTGMERLIEEILKRAPGWRSELTASAHPPRGWFCGARSGVRALAEPLARSPSAAATPALPSRQGVVGNREQANPQEVVCVQQLKSGHSDSIRSVVVSPDGAQIASGGEDTTVVLWNAASGAQLHTLQGHTIWVRSVAFAPGGSTVASGSHDRTIRVWDSSSGLQRLEMNAGAAVRGVAFSPDGAFLAGGCDDGSVQLWHAANGTQVWCRQEHTSYVMSVAFAPDGQMVASGSLDFTARLWASADGQLHRILQGHCCHVLAFSPDGKWLASGSHDKTVILWDPATGQQLHTLTGHTNFVLSVAFDPRAQRLLSGGQDETVRVWDTASGQLLHTFSLPGSYRPFLRFEADGSVTVATHKYETTVTVWRLGLRPL